MSVAEQLAPAAGDVALALTDEQRALVEANLGLVGFVLNKQFPKLAHNDDSYQDGVTGLMRAVVDYDPAKAKFSTYAVWWIRQAITRGHANYMGVNYRRESRLGHHHEAALSLDYLYPDSDDDAGSLAAVMAASGDPAAEAIHRHTLAELTQALHACCRDPIDVDAARRILADATGQQHETFEVVAARHGVTREAIRQRMKRLQRMMRSRFPREAIR